MIQEIIIPANVLNKIQIECFNTFYDMTDSQIDKMINQCVITWEILHSFKSKYGIDDFGGYPLISQNKELQKINITINKKRYRYTTFVEILQRANIIMINDSYSTGTDTNDSFTKSFIFTCEYGNLYKYKIEYSQVKKDNSVLSAIMNKKNISNMMPGQDAIIDTLFNITIDIEGLIKFLESNMGKKLKPKAKKNRFGRCEIITERYIDEECIYDILIDSLRINNRNIWYNEDGRVYNSFTNLSSLASDFIYYGSEKLSEVDVTNCQPLLLSAITNDSELKSVCESGKFYESLMEATGISDRHELKIMCYRDLFFGRYKENSELGKAFSMLFPISHSYLLNYDEDITLAKKLQNLESEIFIGYACSLTIPVLTKHDALFVPFNMKNRVQSELIIKFKQYGITPMFR